MTSFWLYITSSRPYSFTLVLCARDVSIQHLLVQRIQRFRARLSQEQVGGYCMTRFLPGVGVYHLSNAQS